jgi:hypothetical protein
VCIDKQPRAVADFNAASADCADEGRRLPCEVDRLASCWVEPPGVVEWTGDVFDSDRTLAMTDGGVYDNEPQNTTRRYRCVQ